MADIRVTSTGRVFYRIHDDVAALLQEAFPASFEKARTPAVAASPAPTAPHFYVAPSLTTGNIGIHVKLTSGEIRSIFSAATKASAEAALGAGELPQHIWDAYGAKTHTNKNPEWLAEQAARQVAGNKW